MDANSKIGTVDKFVIVSYTNDGTKTETTLNKNFVTNQNATYTNVDAAARALMELSTNTYNDTICVTNISVSGVLAG